MDIYKIRNEMTAGKSIYDIQLRVVYYARVSTDKTDQLNSLKNQVDYYNGFFDSKPNWILIKGYIDEGITGTSAVKREAFLKMIKDAKMGKFDLIITKEVSRFARNTLDTLKFTRELLDNGVGVFFQNDNINTLSTDGELRLTIMSSMAQDESRKISERVKWGHKRGIENGKVLLNNRTWGYRITSENKLEIVPEEAEMIREIYRLYIEGIGTRKIANMLYDKGYKTCNGKELSTSTIKRIIQTPRNKGFFVRNIVTTIDFLSKKRKFLSEDERVIYKDNDKIPPIVDEETWEKANKILNKRGQDYKKEDGTIYSNQYKYSGKIICKEHQVSYWRSLYRYQSGNKEVWNCRLWRTRGKSSCNSPNIYTDELDTMMSSIFKLICNNKEQYVSDLIDIYRKAMKDNDYNKLMVDYNKQVKKIKERKDNLLDLSIDNSITRDEFRIRNEELNVQLEKLKEKEYEINRLKAQSNNIEKELNQIREHVNKFLEFNGEVTNELIDAMIDKIEIEWGQINKSINLTIYIKGGGCFAASYIKNMRLSLITHIIRANIETEISPIVGSEEQSEDLINYLTSEVEQDPRRIWQTNLFGKPLHELVSGELNSKINKMSYDSQERLQETLQRVINDGSGNLICIVL